MVGGYILYRFKSPPRVSTFINLTLWAMSLCVMFLLTFGVWNGSLDRTWTAIYVSLGHTGEHRRRVAETMQINCSKAIDVDTVALDRLINHEHE